MSKIEKRFDAALDLVRWLDQRIAQQVEYYVEQLRCVMSDLIVEEREQTKAQVEELRRQLCDRVTRIAIGLSMWLSRRLSTS